MQPQRPETDWQAVGARIREMREERGWSIRLLARHAEISHAYLAALERAEAINLPSTAPLSRIAHTFGVSLDYLLTGEPHGAHGL